MDFDSPVLRLRAQILLSFGLLTPACGAGPIDADGGATTDPSESDSVSDSSSNDEAESGTDDGTGTSTSTGTDTSTGTSTSTSDTTTEDDEATVDEGPLLDLPKPPLGDCTVTLMDYPATELDPECPLEAGGDGFCWSDLYLGCTPLLGDSCEQQCLDGDCLDVWNMCEGDYVDGPAEGVCGPLLIDGQCCTIAEIITGCAEGRPFLVAGRPRLSALVAGRASGDSTPALPATTRRHLADYWAHVAQAEHASVASFARFAAQLLAVGAPPELVDDALRAAGDEVRHAEEALAIAEVYAGGRLAFGALDTDAAFVDGGCLRELTVACVVEGCIGETLSALELASAAPHCRDPRRAELLEAIADDEARHAGLAWSFVRWALERDPSLRRDVVQAFARLAAKPTDATLVHGTTLDDDHLRAHGCLPADARARVRREGIRELVLPCAELLVTPPASAFRRS